MSGEKHTVWVTLRYRDKQHEIVHDLAESPLLIGRKLLQRLFDVSNSSLRNVSRRHIEVQYDEANQQIWATDTSLLGTLARVVGDEPSDIGPEFLYHHERFLVKRHMRIRLQNEDDSREPDDVVIEIENQNYEETRPIMSKPASWDRMLNHLRTVRAAHLLGMPGTGKSTLTKKLMAPQNTLWQRQRDRQLGGRVLVAWVDCHLLPDRDEPLWRTLSRQILTGLITGAAEQDLPEVRDGLDAALRYFDANVHSQTNEMHSVLRGAIRMVVQKGNARPLIVFDHFDAVFADVNKFMLYQLFQLHQWSDVGEEVQFVIVTRRPLLTLRDDIRDDGVFEFVNLFARHGIRMGCVPMEEFNKLWREIAPEFNYVSDYQLEQLYSLSGGHPGLTRELFEELAVNGWLSQDPERWSDMLRTVNWKRRPSRCCTAVWHAMSPVEQDAMRGLMQGDAPVPTVLEQFRSLGILRVDGTLFSPLFSPVVGTDSFAPTQTGTALVISPIEQRVFVGGQDVTSKLSGRKLEVLMYLHSNANRLCTYQELIENTLPTDSHVDDMTIDAERGSLQRTVSRLCRIVDPKRSYISNEQGRGYRLRYEVNVAQ